MPARFYIEHPCLICGELVKKYNNHVRTRHSEEEHLSTLFSKFEDYLNSQNLIKMQPIKRISFDVNQIIRLNTSIDTLDKVFDIKFWTDNKIDLTRVFRILRSLNKFLKFLVQLNHPYIVNKDKSLSFLRNLRAFRKSLKAFHRAFQKPITSDKENTSTADDTAVLTKSVIKSPCNVQVMENVRESSGIKENNKTKSDVPMDRPDEGVYSFIPKVEASNERCESIIQLDQIESSTTVPVNDVASLENPEQRKPKDSSAMSPESLETLLKEIGELKNTMKSVQNENSSLKEWVQHVQQQQDNMAKDNSLKPVMQDALTSMNMHRNAPMSMNRNASMNMHRNASMQESSMKEIIEVHSELRPTTTVLTSQRTMQNNFTSLTVDQNVPVPNCPIERPIISVRKDLKTPTKNQNSNTFARHSFRNRPPPPSGCPSSFRQHAPLRHARYSHPSHRVPPAKRNPYYR